MFHTIRYLTPRQLAYRFLRFAQGRCRRWFPTVPALTQGGLGPPDLQLPEAWPKPSSRVIEAEGGIAITTPADTLLVSDSDRIPWHAPGKDSLYRYLLAGQGYLLGADTDPRLAADLLLAAARDILRPRTNRTAPLAAIHPLSLRLIHWTRFVCSSRAPELGVAEWAILRRAVAAQLERLLRRIEYETDGNHLIDNGVGLIYGAAFLLAAGALGAASPGPAAGIARRALRRGRRLLRLETRKQILPDGAHYERSTMYQLILLERLLDVEALFGTPAIAEFVGVPDAEEGTGERAALRRRINRVLHWSRRVAWSDGSLPELNDHIRGLAPKLSEIEGYAGALGFGGAEVRPRRGRIAAAAADPSGYLRFQAGRFQGLFDLGAIGPDHVPGHAHADTLQLLLRVNGRPVLVDTGTSLYESGPERDRERGTAAHNAVVYGGRNQSEVWSSFRVARRARVLVKEGSTSRAGESGPTVSTSRAGEADATASGRRAWRPVGGGEHDGYRRYGVLHRRAVWAGATGSAGGARAAAGEATGASAAILIVDSLKGRRRGGRRPAGRATFILNPESAGGLVGPTAGQNSWILDVGSVRFEFRGGLVGRPRIEEWRVASGYRKGVETVRIAVPFSGALETHIYET